MRLASALALAALLAPALARAAWQPGGDLIGEGESFVAAASGGRVVVAWIAASQTELRAQSWTRDGDLAPGWPSGGVLVSALPPGQTYAPTICEDGAGGVFVAWTNYNYMGGGERHHHQHVQHLSATGSPAFGWPAQGLRLRAVPTWAGAAVAAYDGAGGVLVGWGENDYDPHGTPALTVRVLRVGADGSPAAGWPVNGYVIPDAGDVGLAVDDAQHLFVSTGEYHPGQSGYLRFTGVRLRRLGADATPDPEWPQEGTFVPYAHEAMAFDLLPDGTGGVFAGWWAPVICAGMPCIERLPTTTRILNDGTQDGGWNPARAAHSRASDGKGGVLLGVVPGGRPGAVRLDATGAPMPGWAAEGNPAMTEIVNVYDLLVAGDGEGGAFVTWSDGRGARGLELYAARLDATGRLSPGWPETGRVVSARPGGQQVGTQLLSLGGGGAIAVWMEVSPVGDFGYLTALEPGEPGEPGEVVDLGPVRVQARPNPAFGAFDAFIQLSNANPARVELVDVAGRVLETQVTEFSWPPSRAVRLNRDGGLRPGVYWVRVTQGTRSAIEKVILLD